MKKEKIREIDAVYKILAHLYFGEGLEDIRYLYLEDRESLEKFCKNNGETICRIIYALILEKNPNYILKTLQKEAQKASEKIRNQGKWEEKLKNEKRNKI